MAEKVTTTKERQNGLPVTIHPDDAKDKVFTAILKALLKMGNKPSSPKELANIIVKHKYATLGGATPFATVSSRISQHFKRAAEHNPPRAPLLAKHVDQKHSRKINYSLAHDTAADKHIDQNTREHDPTRTNSKIRRFPSQCYKEEDQKIKKHKLRHQYPTPTSSQQIQHEEDSEGEHSDYHEDMLNGDHLNTIHTGSNIPKTDNSDTASSSSVPEDITRKSSFSLGGDQELWTPFSFEHDFDNIFLHDVSSTANNIPLNIATPESISISELDNYFANSTTSSLSHTKRKSFSSTMLGPNDKSLLQKVLLASAARGVAENNKDESQKGKESSTDVQIAERTFTAEKTKENPTEPLTTSNLMDVTNGEDFVKFEEDEKKEAVSPAPPKKILPAAPTNVSAAEILKSMNIQNLNLSALQQVTNNIPSLQHLSSTLDLAKTMAAYMQSLAKSASTSSSPSSSTHATDLKTILTRFPVLEAFIKKDLAANTTPTPPLVSPSTSTFTTGSTDPIIHTLTPTNPPMYITLIDHVAVCVVVLAKTDTTPEYRIMRRIDSGFINGTILLTAGGIDTESERSMILSFEMERVRMPKKKSPLFGTWIPLRRAQELAVTCSVQHKLGHFLDDSIDSFFPSPLPIPVKKKARDGRLTALALAALRSDRTLDIRNKEESSDSEPESDHLDELLSRVASKQPLHIHPRDLQKKKRRHSSATTTTTKGVPIRKSASVSGTTITIKRAKKETAKKATKTQEDEEDEDIDIGGSDCDDDLR